MMGTTSPAFGVGELFNAVWKIPLAGLVNALTKARKRDRHGDYYQSGCLASHIKPQWTNFTYLPNRMPVVFFELLKVTPDEK